MLNKKTISLMETASREDSNLRIFNVVLEDSSIYDEQNGKTIIKLSKEQTDYLRQLIKEKTDTLKEFKREMMRQMMHGVAKTATA